eukprot:TRINITY_DN5218_c0_g1_i2.p1 TRINITY_DN5218_c0_g1~~TRINITY_DN5218_c0_g1_i2.p1  ORF type:complete len:682 (+),score=105.15 TRINITY_DN5218_c0_g1_i2:175-2220(+)
MATSVSESPGGGKLRSTPFSSNTGSTVSFVGSKLAQTRLSSPVLRKRLFEEKPGYPSPIDGPARSQLAYGEATESPSYGRSSLFSASDSLPNLSSMSTSAADFSSSFESPVSTPRLDTASLLFSPTYSPDRSAQVCPPSPSPKTSRTTQSPFPFKRFKPTTPSASASAAAGVSELEEQDPPQLDTSHEIFAMSTGSSQELESCPATLQRMDSTSALLTDSQSSLTQVDSVPLPAFSFFPPPSTSPKLSPPPSPTKDTSAHQSRTPNRLALMKANLNPFSPDRRKLVPEPTPIKPAGPFSPVGALSSPVCDYSRYHLDYVNHERIGSGTFGSVYKCRSRIDGWDYAVKISKKKFRGASQRDAKLKEVYALAALGTHRNIVRYYDAWIEAEQLYIKTEFCAGGSVEQQFMRGVEFTEEHLCELLRQVVSGLSHIHSKNLVHLDLKPENIFITSSSDYKIGDFGLISLADAAKDFEEGLGEEGDSRYLPPELLAEQGIQLPKADVFSLGCAIYELARGKPLPKNGPEWKEIREGVIIVPPVYTPPFGELLRSMLHPQPEHRPSAAQLLSHPLLRNKEQQIMEKMKHKNKLLREGLEKERRRREQAEFESNHAKQHQQALKAERDRVQQLEAMLVQDRERIKQLETQLMHERQAVSSDRARLQQLETLMIAYLSKHQQSTTNAFA